MWGQKAAVYPVSPTSMCTRVHRRSWRKPWTCAGMRTASNRLHSQQLWQQPAATQRLPFLRVICLLVGATERVNGPLESKLSACSTLSVEWNNNRVIRGRSQASALQDRNVSFHEAVRGGCGFYCCFQQGGKGSSPRSWVWQWYH